ncbi:hypothetical protein GP486_003624 [Trichoglossum hirsutum]|uniref:Uncharacterized protein n=1 Tax=Trichoglossum hirsutum TaxID=265104 RepID=A0A9P8RQF6_9PEZI|nr:hypothetical protein GP486_003624 [Trichoglossum hirsutum]
MGIATDTSAFSVLTELIAQPTPTGTEGEAQLLSIISKFPPNVQGFFSSLTAAEVSVASRILNSESRNSVVGSATSSSAQTTSLAAPTASSTAKQNVGALVESEGLGLVLVILGMVIAVL